MNGYARRAAPIVDADQSKRQDAAELKALAAARGIDIGGCVTLADLRQRVTGSKYAFATGRIVGSQLVVTPARPDPLVTGRYSCPTCCPVADPRTAAQKSADLDDAETMATRRSDYPY